MHSQCIFTEKTVQRIRITILLLSFLRVDVWRRGVLIQGVWRHLNEKTMFSMFDQENTGNRYVKNMETCISTVANDSRNIENTMCCHVHFCIMGVEQKI